MPSKGKFQPGKSKRLQPKKVTIGSISRWLKNPTRAQASGSKRVKGKK